MVDTVVVKPCKYILNKEECPYGSRCRFGHGSFERENKKYKVTDEGNEPTHVKTLPNNPAIHKESGSFKQKNCYFYLHSHCRYGNKCKFNHPHRSGYGDHKPTSTIDTVPMPTEVATDQRDAVNTAIAYAEQGSSYDGTTGSVKQEIEASTGKRRFRANPNKNPTRQESRNKQRATVEHEDLANSKRSSETSRVPRQREGNVHKAATNEGKMYKSGISGRTRKMEDYHSRSAAPPPLTLESFLTRQPVKRPQRGASRQKDTSKGNLREIELEQLQVRFPCDNCELLEKSKDIISYLIRFKPTDQDWHGPETILLKVTFPDNYPDQFCSVELSMDQDILPEAVEVFNMASESYWSADMRGTLMFRPFLHWMDKNIVELLHIQPRNKHTSEGEGGGGGDTDNSASGQDDEGEETEESVVMSSVVVKSKKGTEIRLSGLNTGPNLGTAYWSVISVVLACSRCKTHKQVELKEERGYSVVCERCNCSYTAVYHLALIHAASFTIGYLELSNCSPVDVVFQSSSLTLTCLDCNCEVTSVGFFIDQPKDEYCRRCHNKMTISASGVRFLQHQQMATPTSLDNVTVLPASGKRAQSDLIKDGCPLPDYGVCQHYKKSHRWLRFPCCGRAFPCDVCHDAAQDHPMDRATRMICGYCSKEQGYSGDCARCGADLLSSKSTAHWEGGQGCRNKVKMNRLDKHKYKNSDIKTTCKKSERVGKKSS